jgi:hypothetical protein
LVGTRCMAGYKAFAVSLVGTELLRVESLRVLAVLLLVGAGILGVLAWSDSQWSAAFPTDPEIGLAYTRLQVRRRKAALAILAAVVLLFALSHIAFLTAPHATFGAVGWLWVTAVALIIPAAALQGRAEPPRNGRVEEQSAWS